MPTQPNQTNFQKFEHDYENLKNSIAEYEALVHGQGKPGDKDYIPGENNLKSAYQTELGKFNETVEHNKDNPFLVMMAFMMLILGSGTTMMNGKTNLVAERFHFQSQFAKCQTDLQGITDSSTVNTKGSFAGSTKVLEVACGLNKLENLIQPGSEGASIFGTSGAAAIEANLSTVRNQIYVGDEESCKSSWDTLDSKDQAFLKSGLWGNKNGLNNPAGSEISSENPIYFEVGDSKGYPKAFSSYGEAIADLADQKDSTTASAALTQKTNAFSTNTSMLQSVQAGTKELITEEMNVVKTLESAGSSIGHSISQVSSAAINNQKAG